MVRPCGPHGLRFVGFFYAMNKVIAFIDGFNLYHSLHNLRQPHLKWLDLWDLSEALTRPKSETLVDVLYFSAYATWLPSPYKRHRQYVTAQVAVGVTPIMGHFKEKDRMCRKCGTRWKAHEEKETDVNIAVSILRLAHQDAFDRALLVTRDSDLAPALRAIRADFPTKELTVVAPPSRSGHSTELIAASTSKATIKVRQLERCLLPEVVTDAGGNIAARRPKSYNPPS